MIRWTLYLQVIINYIERNDGQSKLASVFMLCIVY